MELSFLFRSKISGVVTFFYFFLLVWWLKIYLLGGEVGLENYLFNLSYIFFNVVGGFFGLKIAREKWGGFKSILGRSISFLSLGLLGQGFGLIIWTYYNLIVKVEIPYPSLADIGYFSLIPFYSLAMVNFAMASGVKFGLKTLIGKFQVVAVPAVMFLLSYILFLKNVGIDLSDPVKTFLDIGYPAGEALSVSLGLLTFSLSRQLLGGRMKKRVLFIIFALVIQYVTEFTFLYTSGIGVYYNASFVDLMYATSYFVMTLGLLSMERFDD